MEQAWRYRGRTITSVDVGFIRELIAAHPTAGRCELSRRLCAAWDWKQPNGTPRDMVCRGMLLMLDRGGQIELPPMRSCPPNPLLLRGRPEPVVPDNRPVRGTLGDLLPLEIEQVRRSEEEPLFNSLMEQYHYLGYEQPVGEHLKYLVKARGQAIACLAWSSAPRHLGSRDRFIGWNPAARRRNIHLIAYNTRFLILPWVRVPHLASHILGRMARQAPRDWERKYAHPIYLLETFIDPQRFAGTCYRAANWIVVGNTTGRGKDAPSKRPNRSIKQVLALPLHRRFRQLLSQSRKTMKLDPETIDISMEELETLVDGARDRTLNAGDHRKLRGAVETLGEMARLLANRDATLRQLRQMLLKPATTEKTRVVLERAGVKPEPGEPAVQKKKRKGHGRNPARAFEAAEKVTVAHPMLKPADPCPECGKGKVYPLKEPAVRVRIVGQAPVQATVYQLERLRCNLCQQVYEAPPPAQMGEDKREETAASMVALLKYGSGVPYYRLEGLQANLGIPLPRSTQWDMVAKAAKPLQPVYEELIRQAAQGEVLYNDDTAVRILALQRETAPERTGVFTTGIVAVAQGRRMALFFSGDKHAGENLADVLRRRAAGLPPPIQMCDALSRNAPKLAPAIEPLMGNCLAHLRRNFVEVAPNFTPECQYVLETLGEVYGNDKTACEQTMTPDERLAYHRGRSGPLMEQLRQWGERQLDEHTVEPNSGLGKAIRYLLKHWEKLTLFLRQPGAPLDSNIVERALKKAILNRKNGLFYKTRNGARVGDLYMSLIHTCELCGGNPFDYLTELQKHAAQIERNPAAWMPWNYHATLDQAAPAKVA